MVDGEKRVGVGKLLGQRDKLDPGQERVRGEGEKEMCTAMKDQSERGKTEKRRWRQEVA